MGGFDDAVIQVPEVAHTPFHFSCAEERSWIRIPAFQKDVSALKYKRFSSSCAASCSMSGFNLRSTDIPVLLRDADPYIFFCPWHNSPPVGQDPLIIEASRSHSDTPPSVALLWMSDRPDAETSTWRHTMFIKRQTSVSPLGFEPEILASERPQTRALDRAVPGMVAAPYYCRKFIWKFNLCIFFEVRSTHDAANTASDESFVFNIVKFWK